jgi:FAD binding domain
MKTRREFVNQSTVLATASVLGIGGGPCLAAFASGIDAALIERFRNKLSGRLILPTDAGYDAARAVATRNPETDKRPAVIAQCKSEQDVLRSIDFAHENQLDIAIRSGNHSFLGWGTCDRGIVVDLSPMKGVSVDPAKRSAVVATGSNAGEIIASTARFGLAPVLGECPTVGAGLALGGGLGWLSPLYGATCDNVLSARVITAKATILDVHDTSNEDLFWAIRGGGGNFGIATQLQYQLHPVNQVLAGSLIYPVSMARTMLRFFCDFMSAAPDEVQAECQLRSDDGGQFCVEIVCSGNLDRGDNLVNQFRKLSSPIRDFVRPRRYVDLYAMNDWDHSWNFQL